MTKKRNEGPAGINSGMAITHTVTDDDVTEAVSQAIGEASMCWERPQDAGVFDSTRAAGIADRLVESVKGKRPGVKVNPTSEETGGFGGDYVASGYTRDEPKFTFKSVDGSKRPYRRSQEVEFRFLPQVPGGTIEQRLGAAIVLGEPVPDGRVVVYLIEPGSYPAGGSFATLGEVNPLRVYRVPTVLGTVFVSDLIGFKLQV